MLRCANACNQIKAIKEECEPIELSSFAHKNMVFTEFHFDFANKSSRAYDLIIANVNTGEFTQSSGTFESSYLFNKKNKRNYLLHDDYSNSRLSIDVDIVVHNGATIPARLIKEIEKWLFCNSNFQKFYIDLADDQYGETYDIIGNKTHRLYMMCRFTNPIKITDGSGGIIGWTATLQCDSNEFYQDEITKTFDTTSTKTFTVTTDVVDIGYIYPIVKLTVGSTGGNISITNVTDSVSRHTSFKSVSPRSVIRIDCERNMLTDGFYDKFSDKNFIRLLDGNNTFNVTGDIVSVDVTYINRRML